MIYRLVILVLLLNSTIASAQFYPAFSAFMETGLLYNPALAGNNEQLSSTIGFRSQWSGLVGAPSYLFLSADLPSKREKLGLGFNFFNESIGLNRNTMVNGNLSYKFLLSKGICSMGLSFGFKNSRFNLSGLELSQVEDPAFSGSSNSVFSPYAGFGFAYSIDDFSFDFGFMDVLNSSYSRNLNASVNYSYDLNNKLLMKTFVFYKRGMTNISQLEIGSSFEYNRKLGCYIGYRTNQDFILGLKVNVSKQLYMMYNYDFTTRYFNDYSYGSNELILRFNFIEEIQAHNPRDF